MDMFYQIIEKEKELAAVLSQLNEQNYHSSEIDDVWAVVCVAKDYLERARVNLHTLFKGEQ